MHFMSHKCMKLQNLDEDPDLLSPSLSLQPQAELHPTLKRDVELTSISCIAKSTTFVS